MADDVLEYWCINSIIMLSYDYECKHIDIDIIQISIIFNKVEISEKWSNIYLILLIAYLKIKYLIKKQKILH